MTSCNIHSVSEVLISETIKKTSLTILISALCILAAGSKLSSIPFHVCPGTGTPQPRCPQTSAPNSTVSVGRFILPVLQRKDGKATSPQRTEHKGGKQPHCLGRYLAVTFSGISNPRQLLSGNIHEHLNCLVLHELLTVLSRT